MFRRSLPARTGMWIAPCNGIHTFFMRFPIDVIFLDRKQRVVRVCLALRRRRIVPMVLGAHSVVELPAGTAEGLHLPRGEQLVIQSSANPSPSRGAQEGGPGST